MLDVHYLEALGLISADNTILIQIDRNGQKLFRKLPMTNSNLYIDLIYSGQNSSKDFNKWDIDKENDIGIFHMIDFTFYTELNAQLKIFFTEIHNKKIGNVGIDLSRFQGIKLDTAEPILKYLNVNKYVTNGFIIRHSKCTEGINYDKSKYKDEIIKPRTIVIDRSNVDKNNIFN